ncbi:MAG TPA: RNA polymerase sigma factor [Taishania sp.]|nr:RNA polymerase sigma factor [Taishania sp.]
MSWFQKSYEQYTDEQLMKKLASGNQLAFDELYARYANVLLNYFHRMLWKDREKAEDFVHDLFLKIIQNPNSFDTSRTFKTWIYSVANNMCKNEYKKQQVRAGSNLPLHEYTTVEGKETDALIKTHFSFFNEAFNKQLYDLDEKHREVFIMRHLEGLSIKEISSILGVNEGTIKSRIFYAVKQLSNGLTAFNLKNKTNHG